MYMLDTNIVSLLIRGNTNVVGRFKRADPSEICISAITEAELAYGLAKKPGATKLAALVTEFLQAVEIVPWDCAKDYGGFRAEIERHGITLSAMDLLIAVHAHAVGAILVTNDGDFSHAPGLHCEDWTA